MAKALKKIKNNHGDRKSIGNDWKIFPEGI